MAPPYRPAPRHKTTAPQLVVALAVARLVVALLLQCLTAQAAPPAGVEPVPAAAAARYYR